MQQLRRSATVAVIFVVALLLALLPAPAAHAEEPMAVDQVVTDTTSTLSHSDITEIESAAEELENATGSKLYVIIVNTFENPTDGNDWASSVAVTSEMSAQDIIFYIGKEENELGLNVDQSLPLGSTERSKIERNAIDEVNQGNITGAVTQVASELADALGTTASTDGAGSSNPMFTIVLGAIVLVVLVVIAVLALLNRRRRKQQLAQAQQQEAEELEARLTKASAQLVHMDNLIRSSEEEMHFAAAQFGTDEVKAYRTEIEMAKQAAREAFDLQAKLLDHIPDTPQDREAWIERILSVSETASTRLGNQAAHFQQLRVKQNDAPKLLAAVQSALAAAAPKLAPLQTWAASLADTYAAVVIEKVRADVAQAAQLLELGHDEAAGASESLAAGNAGAAIVDITDAENALAQFHGLCEALLHTKATFERAPQQLQADATALRRTLARVKDAHAASGNYRAHVANTVAEADAVLADAEAASNGTIADPVGLIDRLHATTGALDRALGELLGEQQRIEHAKQRIPAAMRDARSEIAATNSFIASKRGAVSSQPRTRLDQAEAQFARAESLQTADPVTALSLYNDADQLARTAMQTAQREVESAYASVGGSRGGDDWSSWLSPTSYGSHRPRRRSGGDDFLEGMGGAILGGIIGGILNGSGSSRRHSNDWSGFGGFSGGGGTRGGGFSGGGGTR